MIADAVVLAIVLLSAYLGYKKGFVKTVSKVVCLLIAIVAAKLLYPYVAEYVSNSAVGDFIREKIVGGYTDFATANLPVFLQKAGDSTANGVAESAISIVTVVAIIIITYLVSKLAAAVLGVVAKLPVISFLNRVAGLGAGVVMGILVAYVIVALVIFTGVDGVEQWLAGSRIAVKMYMDNFLINLIL